jgi:hypothetical protein
MNELQILPIDIPVNKSPGFQPILSQKTPLFAMKMPLWCEFWQVSCPNFRLKSHDNQDLRWGRTKT